MMVDNAILNLTQPAGELARLAIFLLDNFDGVGQGEPYRDIPPEGTIGWFKDLCERLAKQGGDLRRDCREATAAAQRYRDWLAENLDSMEASAAIGTENYNWYLKHVRLLPQTVDDLQAIGKREFHRYRFNYILDSYKNASLDELELTQSAEEHRRRTREAEAKTRKLVEELNLFTIPDYMPSEFESDVFLEPPRENGPPFLGGTPVSQRAEQSHPRVDTRAPLRCGNKEAARKSDASYARRECPRGRLGHVSRGDADPGRDCRGQSPRARTFLRGFDQAR